MRELVHHVRRRLAELADPAKAGSMQAYMKTDMPFHGVPKPQRALIARELKKDFEPATQREYRAAVLALWRLPHREEKYLAIGFAQMWPRFVTPAAMPLYRRLIEEGAWWDFVDDVAIRLVGRVLSANRSEMAPVMDQWIDHSDMWIRRSAIISQVGHKLETDEQRLFDYSLRRAHEREFFIRKAIGWALREYAWTEPAGVRKFLRQYGHQLSPLSLREAAKNLGRPAAGRRPAGRL